MPSCAVKWCGKHSKTSNYKKDGVTFHRFPKIPKLKEKWIDKVDRENWFPTKYSAICSRHFTPDCFENLKHRRRLFKSAIPTMFLPILNSNTMTNSQTNEPGSSHHNTAPGLDSTTEIPDPQAQDEEESMIAEMVTVKTEECEPEDCPPELEEMTIGPLGERKRELYLTIKPPEPSSSKIARIEQVSSLVNEPETSQKPKEKSNEEGTNEFDIFGKYVALQLKYLYEEDAILAQDEIHSILTRFKLKKVRNKIDKFRQSSNS